MCGITGIYAFNDLGAFHMINLSAATDALSQRGPDSRGTYAHERMGLGHRRLSILDTSYRGHQPMSDPTGRYTIVFNGEIYNYRELRGPLEAAGLSFESGTDTEVLLHLYMREGTACLQKLNGFFAFAVYDQQEDALFVARDRMGIKPLHYFLDDDKLIFASELKSLLAYGIQKELDYTALLQYLQFNYIPAPASILKGVQKLLPGHFLEVKGGKATVHRWYALPHPQEPTSLSYARQQERLRELLEASVQRRLVADVPLGSFLSGGIDSSVIATLASRHTDKLMTFSIGYKDNKFFDETEYARAVAQKLGTDHQVFSLSNSDLFGELHHILNYFDEPFADSSALPVSILSQRTRGYATVALSGDGADELFSGYHKHMAYYRALHPGWKEKAVSAGAALWRMMPKSRNNKLGNFFRQLDRFAGIYKLSPAERYWQLAQYAGKEQACSWLHAEKRDLVIHEDYQKTKDLYLQPLYGSAGINDMLAADMQLVLVNDMLTKVDLMSMMRGLEVRVPFLDHEFVSFAFTLPEASKINTAMKKRILQDAFRNDLPPQLYKRPKKGFEVPLLDWFRTDLRSKIEEELGERFIAEQGIFDPAAMKALRQQLFSSNPGDAPAHIWALLVFQSCWKNYLS